MGNSITLLNLFYAVLFLATCIGVFGTLAGFFGRSAWVLDLFSHFRLQYLLALGVCCLLFLTGAHILEAFLSGSAALVNLVLILPAYIPLPKLPGSPPNHRVLFCNVLQENRQYQKVVTLVEREDPQIIIFVEANQQWMEGLQSLAGSYPYLYTSAVQDDHFGVVLFSQLPFDKAEICRFGSANLPSLVVRLRLDGHLLTVIGTHTWPPKRRSWSLLRDEQLLQIAEFASQQPGEVMMVGDFNLSPWSPFFKELLSTGRLRDSRQGFGLQLTWPADLPFFLTPIDHILVSAGIAIVKRKVGPFIGSDHYPIMMDFAFQH
jgi:endonuclease/exonuclease/phosphatase (EEP) superfamily protein YafD